MDSKETKKMMQEEHHNKSQSDYIDNTEDLKELPPDFDKEEIQWQRELMKERMKYLNKHYKNFRK